MDKHNEKHKVIVNKRRTSGVLIICLALLVGIALGFVVHGNNAVQSAQAASWENYVVELTWGADPRDIDSHLTGAATDEELFHVYYADKTANGAWLDYDDTDGFGPEYITIEKEGRYQYHVEYYAGEGTVSSSGAVVKLFRGDNLLRTYYVPENGGSGKYWNVFEIDGNYIYDKNYITDELPVLGDSELGLPTNTAFDEYFNYSSATYNHNLAITAAQLSNSVYAMDDIVFDLSDLGFSDIDNMGSYEASHAINKDNYKHIVAYTFGRKTLSAGQDLIAIVVRGTEGAEWYSNFDIGLNDFHEGFFGAYQDLRAKLEQYLGGSFNYDNAKFFLTGHSRGAAVANLAAADLSGAFANSLGAQKANVFCYTFAAPNVAKIGTNTAALYPSIFNLVNAEDMVPYMPLEKWGFRKYGITMTMNQSERSAQVAAQYFKELTGDEYKTAEDGGVSMIGFIESMYKDVATVSDYYNKTKNDITAYEFFRALAAINAGDGIDISTIAKRFGWAWTLWRQLNNINYAHKMTAYIAWMQTYGSGGINELINVGRYNRNVTMINIDSPVDFDIFDANNQLVGAVTDNEVLDENTRRIYISADDNERNLLMFANQNYKIKMRARNYGTLDYHVRDLDLSLGEVTETKSFTNIALSPGRTFGSTVSGNIDTSDVGLFLMNGEGETFSEVSTDGQYQLTDVSDMISFSDATFAWDSFAISPAATMIDLMDGAFRYVDANRNTLDLAHLHVGTYSITAVYDSITAHGEKTAEFTVTKANGINNPLVLEIENETLSAADISDLAKIDGVLIEYKVAGEADSKYATTVPKSNAVYVVRITFKETQSYSSYSYKRLYVIGNASLETGLDSGKIDETNFRFSDIFTKDYWKWSSLKATYSDPAAYTDGRTLPLYIICGFIVLLFAIAIIKRLRDN